MIRPTFGEIGKLLLEGASDPSLVEHEARQLLTLGALVIQALPLEQQKRMLEEASYKERLQELKA